MQGKNYKEEIERIECQIKALECERDSLLMQFAGQKLGFGKYKGLTYAEVAHKDLQYFNWMMKEGLIPPMSSKQYLYVTTKIHNEYESAFAKEYERMKEEQGYVGRYMI